MYNSELKYNRIKSFLLSAYFEQHSCMYLVFFDWLIMSCARHSNSCTRHNISCARLNYIVRTT